MKIKHLLESEDKTKLFDAIINSKFFKINYAQIIMETDENELPALRLPWLFHASDKIEGKRGIFDLKLREKPRDTSAYVHNFINSKAKEMFGLPIRNLLFSFSIKSKIVDFGYTDYILFPLNDDYQIFRAKGIWDLTEVYTNSKHGSDRMAQFIDYFSEKYREFNKIPNIQWMNRHVLNAFNRIENDEQAYEFAYEVFTESGIIDDIAKKYAKAFTKYHRKFVDEQATDYLKRVESVKEIKIQHDEYMVYSKSLAYILIEDKREFLSYAKEKLLK